MGEVARRLEELDPALEARVEHTGGGIFCIQTELGDGRFLNWGTELPMWTADLCDADGDYLESVPADVPADTPDAGAVAGAILAATRRVLALGNQ